MKVHIDGTVENTPNQFRDRVTVPMSVSTIANALLFLNQASLILIQPHLAKHEAVKKGLQSLGIDSLGTTFTIWLTLKNNYLVFGWIDVV